MELQWREIPSMDGEEREYLRLEKERNLKRENLTLVNADEVKEIRRKRKRLR